MPAPAELVNLPHALTEMMVKQRADYERAVRAVRWGELPVWVVGSAESLPAAEALGWAFEDLLTWPVMVREASSFIEGAAGMLRPGSVVVVFMDQTASPQEAVRAARKRGAQVLVVSGGPAPAAGEPPSAPPGPDSPLALALPSAGAAAEGGIGAACLQHAAAAQLALTCTRQLARPRARLDRSERDWRDLPSHLDRLAGQLSDGVATLGRELQSLSPILLAGDGCYAAAARRGAALVRLESRRPVIGLDRAAFGTGWLQVLSKDSAVLLLSGSSGPGGKASVELAASIKARGCPIFAVTGSNHYDLIRQARLSLILPEVGDLGGSVLALAISGWIGSYLGI